MIALVDVNSIGCMLLKFELNLVGKLTASVKILLICAYVSHYFRCLYLVGFFCYVASLPCQST